MRHKIFIHIPCAGPEKLPLLWSTLSSLFSATQSLIIPEVHIRVTFNCEPGPSFHVPNDGRGLDTLTEVFKSIGVTFEVKYAPGAAVAAMYLQSVMDAKQEGFRFLLKVDDDCLFTNLDSFLDNLTSYIFEPFDFITFNFWDLVNHRQYDDWFTSVPYRLLPAMVEKFGERTLWCHRWLDTNERHAMPYSPDTVVNASMYAIRLSAFDPNGPLAKALQKYRPGMRGMDHTVGNATEWNGRRGHSLHTYATHLGVFRPQLDKQYWTSFEGDDKVIEHSGLIADGD